MGIFCVTKVAYGLVQESSCWRKLLMRNDVRSLVYMSVAQNNNNQWYFEKYNFNGWVYGKISKK